MKVIDRFPEGEPGWVYLSETLTDGQYLTVARNMYRLNAQEYGKVYWTFGQRSSRGRGMEWIAPSQPRELTITLRVRTAIPT